MYLTAADVPPLAAALGLDEEAFIERYTELTPDRRGLRLAGAPDAPCLFLAGDRCGVYAARPRQCRTYPEGWRTAQPCPGVSPPASARA